jgi:predicted ArsR family transcriptional regulator
MSDTTIINQNKQSLVIDWPNGDFTVKDVVVALLASNNTVSPVTVHLRLHKDMDAGLVEELSETRKGRGRPQKVYRKVSK